MAIVKSYFISSCWGTPIIWIDMGRKYLPLGSKRTRELLEKTLDKAIIGKSIKIHKHEKKGKDYAEILL